MLKHWKDGGELTQAPDCDARLVGMNSIHKASDTCRQEAFFPILERVERRLDSTPTSSVSSPHIPPGCHILYFQRICFGASVNDSFQDHFHGRFQTRTCSAPGSTFHLREKEAGLVERGSKVGRGIRRTASIYTCRLPVVCVPSQGESEGRTILFPVSFPRLAANPSTLTHIFS